MLASALYTMKYLYLGRQKVEKVTSLASNSVLVKLKLVSRQTPTVRCVAVSIIAYVTHLAGTPCGMW